MPETCLPSDVAPAAAANEAIRRFMRQRWGRPLWPEERVEYWRLLEAWAAAQRGDVTAAA
ncbi:hypothetical protein ACFYOY_13005 [Streptomyces sp. NPDC007875]|uniref:hypothetical protein n=1 Tax=Streptomyces sp. NPDC007875 TaxID=3364783 RepID=UPI0036A22527